MSSTENSTPLMKQYWDLKSQIPDGLLLFRMGDFYELFGEDAIEASRILEITLTSRDKNKPNPIPMAGVPHHSIQGYLQKLLKAGKKVALGEQMEDPSQVKGIVRREITRVFTPGVQFDSEGADAHYLACFVKTPQTWILACLDVSTGDVLISDPMSAEALSEELAQPQIKHILYLNEPGIPESLLMSDRLTESLPSNYLSQPQALACLRKQYEMEHFDSVILHPEGLRALGILITYALKSQKQERLAHLKFPAPLHRPKTLALGPRTAAHLDLFTPDGTPSLFQLLNKTRSALGARQLRKWLLAPLKEVSEISKRQEGVREISSSLGLEKISDFLSQVYDLERILGRVNSGLANPRDTLALGKSLQAAGDLLRILEPFRSETLTTLRADLNQNHQIVQSLAHEIVTNQRDDAPLISREGGIFNKGTTPDLDHLLSLTENGERWLVELEARERAMTQIPSLKVRYNRVFGYYIEITQAHLKNVPAHYQRKQTMMGAERFFTEELKKFEDDILNASSRQKALESSLFSDLLKSIQSHTSPIMTIARVFGELDTLTALARLSLEPAWCFPVIDDSLDLEISEGRHPLVDQASPGSFVPNSLELSPQSRMTLMITGPNMGGKSTIMRQTALIVFLGQMGAPVPAASARWGSVSSVYTRIGAHDAIARGQSTFMVEMTELAQILHQSDERSLIVLDEIGRGTSTYDGISVAWATLEWICTQIRARTLFATHYHELTGLAGEFPLLANAHMAVEGARAPGQRLRFLYRLKEGPTNESFGIHVAKIAGLPKPVIDQAWRVLEDLETNSLNSGKNTQDPRQLSLFAPTAAPRKAQPVPPHPVVQALEEIDVNEMTPIQALNFVAKLREISHEPDSKSV